MSSNSRLGTPKGRKYKFAKGLGMHEHHKYYCANRHKEDRFILSKMDYFKIIRLIHKMFMDAILRGETVHLPRGMGDLFLARSENRKMIRDGRLIVNAPVDWKATYELWDEDDESRSNKTLVRFNTKYRYIIKWNKGKFINAETVEFIPTRGFKSEMFYPAQAELEVPTLIHRLWKRQ